jgi:hypothetical protein
MLCTSNLDVDIIVKWTTKEENLPEDKGPENLLRLQSEATIFIEV